MSDAATGYQIVMVHMNASAEVFGGFETERAATHWALANQAELNRSASWRIEPEKDRP